MLLLKNPTPLHDKGLGEIWDNKNIPKHNKKRYTANQQPASN